MCCAASFDSTTRGTATRGDAGFTIVELIAVLLLLGILAATAMSRLVGSNAYAPALVSEQLIALGRLAQQTALSRQDAAVSLDIDQNAGDWRMRVLVDDGTGPVTMREELVEIRNTAIAVSNGAVNLPLGATVPLHVGFDGLGSLASTTGGATILDPSVGIGIGVTGDSAYSVCIGSTGHAYRGNCS
jgi:prepilin-type N-terminal cleavage/methylation domain-containing protein